MVSKTISKTKEPCRILTKFSKTRFNLSSLLMLFLIAALIVTGLYVRSTPNVEAYSGTNLYVSPATTNKYTNTTQIGDTFEVSLAFGNMSKLYGYGYTLYWNNAVLRLISVHDMIPANLTGGFLATNTTINNYNATYGQMNFIYTATGVKTFTGSATFRTITFQILTAPSSGIGSFVYSKIAFGAYGTETTFGDNQANLIPTTVHNGEFYYYRNTLPPSIYVNPATVTRYTDGTHVGDTFQVSVLLANVTNLFGYQYTLTWNDSIINFVNIHDTVPLPPGYFLAQNTTSGGQMDFIVTSTSGYGVVGSFSLRTIVFKIMRAPASGELYSKIALTNDVLGDPSANAIPHSTHDGTFLFIALGPRFGTIITVPVVPNYDQSVTVLANITDNAPLSAAFLCYSTGSWHNVSMSLAQGFYRATIPPQPYGTNVQYKIYAGDANGMWNVSTVNYYVVGDFVPPAISNLNHVPTCPFPYVKNLTATRFNEPTFVTANVTEPSMASGVAKVTFSYRVNSNPWWNTTMALNSTSNLWSVTIPSQNGGVTVQFFVTAYDKAGNVALSATYSFNVKALPTGDLNGDGKVNVLDLIIVATHL